MRVFDELKKKKNSEKKTNQITNFLFQIASKQKNPKTNDAYSSVVSSTLIASILAFITVKSLAV